MSKLSKWVRKEARGWRAISEWLRGKKKFDILPPEDRPYISHTPGDFFEPSAGPVGTEKTIGGDRFIWNGSGWVQAGAVRPGTALHDAWVQVTIIPEEARRKSAPLLAALEQLRIAREPHVRREAFTPFAKRGFGASGLAQRGIAEALGEEKARFAGRAEEIKSQAFKEAVEEAAQREQTYFARNA